MSNADKLVSRIDTSAASMARDLFTRTGRQTSPYRAYPEREQFVIIETYERPDGSTYRRECTVSVWGGERSSTDWKML